MHDHDYEQASRIHRTPPPAPESATRSRDGAAGAPVGTSAGSAPLSPAAILGLQRTAGNASVVQLLGADEEQASPVHDVVGKGGGTALDPGVQNEMEGRFGQSFANVRVHTDAQASASAESVGANAYTVGNDIVFRSGHFDTSSPTGQRTLAHELTHVVQQRSGPVDGSPAAGGINLSSPSDRFEKAAEHNAESVMAGPAPESEDQAPTAQRVVQREGEEEELEEEPAG
jgi:hypothetical protein